MVLTVSVFSAVVDLVFSVLTVVFCVVFSVGLVVTASVVGWVVGSPIVVTSIVVSSSVADCSKGNVGSCIGIVGPEISSETNSLSRFISLFEQDVNKNKDIITTAQISK